MRKLNYRKRSFVSSVTTLPFLCHLMIWTTYAPKRQHRHLWIINFNVKICALKQSAAIPNIRCRAVLQMQSTAPHIQFVGVFPLCWTLLKQLTTLCWMMLKQLMNRIAAPPTKRRIQQKLTTFRILELKNIRVDFLSRSVLVYIFLRGGVVVPSFGLLFILSRAESHGQYTFVPQFEKAK